MYTLLYVINNKYVKYYGMHFTSIISERGYNEH